MLLFALQWDETAQRFAIPKPTGGTSRAKQTKARIASQVMVVAGSIVDCGISSEGISVQPYFANTLIVKETSANILLEGILRTFPFDFENGAAMAALATQADMLVISLTVDRASANLLMAKWVASVCCNLPPNILPWCELCGAHGAALVKAKSPLVKGLSAALCSFTHWMRFSKNVDVLTAEIRFQISQNFEVRRAPCTEEFKQPGMRLIKAIYGGEQSSALWRWDEKRGRFVETPFLCDLQGLCSVTTFGGDGPAWVRHCYVTEDPPEARSGQQVGVACCRSSAESIQKIADQVLNLCAGRAWQVAHLQRWTNVSSVCRRFAMLSAAGNILIGSLRGVKTHWGLADGLAAELARVVDADRNDFSPRNKLRLLRIVQGLSADDARVHMAIATITGDMVDKVLFSILGGPQRPRVPISALVDPVTSPIVECQCNLRQCLEKFDDQVGDENTPSPWLLFNLLGGRREGTNHRVEARRAVLQLSAALLDYFELRMQKPPYRLLWLTTDIVPLEQKNKVVSEFFEEPEECLPLFCSRLRAAYPSEERFKASPSPQGLGSAEHPHERGASEGDGGEHSRTMGAGQGEPGAVGLVGVSGRQPGAQAKRRRHLGQGADHLSGEGLCCALLPFDESEALDRLVCCRRVHEAIARIFTWPRIGALQPEAACWQRFDHRPALSRSRGVC